MMKKKQHHFQQRSYFPVQIQPSSATYDPDEMHSLHQQIFLRHDAWQTELSTVLVTLLIIAHRRLLFDKFRELSSFYRTSIFFKENARNWFGSYQCVRESVNKKICVKITPNAWILTGLQHVHQQLIQ